METEAVLARGMTIADRRHELSGVDPSAQARVTVVSAVDGQRFKERFFELVGD